MFLYEYQLIFKPQQMSTVNVTFDFSGYWTHTFDVNPQITWDDLRYYASQLSGVATRSLDLDHEIPNYFVPASLVDHQVINVSWTRLRDHPLHSVAHDGNGYAIEAWIAVGEEVDVRDEDGRTPLMYAVMGAQRDVIPLLLWLGADINAVDFQGWTALHHAGHKRYDVIGDDLIAAGADTTIRSHGGQTYDELLAEVMDEEL